MSKETIDKTVDQLLECCKKIQEKAPLLKNNGTIAQAFSEISHLYLQIPFALEDIIDEAEEEGKAWVNDIW
jgi:hypothetical protein